MKRLIPVIHYLNTKQVLTNVETCLDNGIKNIFLINHFTDYIDLLNVYNLIKVNYPDLWVGLNFLDLEPVNVFGMDLNFDGLWFDKTLTFEDNLKFMGEIFSGLNFKYQKQYNGSDLDKMVDLVKKTSTTACTSGRSTGIEANIDNIKELKFKLGDFRLGLASGVSDKNIGLYLPYVDDFLVASSITDSNEIIDKYSLNSLINEFQK